MVPAHVIAGAIDTHRANLIFNRAIPIAVVIWAAKRTAQVSDSPEQNRALGPVHYWRSTADLPR